MIVERISGPLSGTVSTKAADKPKIEIVASCAPNTVAFGTVMKALSTMAVTSIVKDLRKHSTNEFHEKMKPQIPLMY